MTRRALLVVLLAGCASLPVPARVPAPPPQAALPPPPYAPFAGQSFAEALDGHAEGLSDLQLDPAGDSFLGLTSHEGTHNTPEGHSGHLFRIPAAVLLGAVAPAPGPVQRAVTGVPRQARGARGNALRCPDRGL